MINSLCPVSSLLWNSFPSIMDGLYRSFTQNKERNFLNPPIYGSTGLRCPRTDEGESPTLGSGAWPLEGAPSTVKKGRSQQQPRLRLFCCWRVCRLPMVVSNCGVHCVPLVSQVYFLNQHKKKMIRASAWRRLCFHLRPMAWDLKQKLVQMEGCAIMTLTTMEIQTSPRRMCPAPSCRPRPFSVAAT